MKYGLGYKPDAVDSRDIPAAYSLGLSSAATTVVPASLKRFRVGRLEQGQAGSCVAHALDRAIDICLRYAFDKLGKPGIEPLKASRRFMYFNARRQESGPIVDGGCFPRNAMKAVQQLGYCPESVFPYSDDAAAINEVPPPTAFQQAFDQSNFRYYRVTSTGVARVAEVARALAQGKPVIFGTFADTAMEEWDGKDAIDQLDPSDPNGGGHMLCVLEVTADEVITDNWWGDGWGRNGLAAFTHRLFGSALINDIYVIETAPVFATDPQEAA